MRTVFMSKFEIEVLMPGLKLLTLGHWQVFSGQNPGPDSWPRRQVSSALPISVRGGVGVGRGTYVLPIRAKIVNLFGQMRQPRK